MSLPHTFFLRKPKKGLLYPFSSFTFSHGEWARYPTSNGASPRQGSQSTASLGDSLSVFRNIYTSQSPLESWFLDTSYFNVTTPGIQEWVCPKLGLYRVTVAGARGGSNGAMTGGPGAVITQDIILKGGVKYFILVGKKGEDTETGVRNAGAGGGGGSFFFLDVNATTPILAAGGGGGSSKDSNGTAASLLRSANSSAGGLSGGPLGGIAPVNSGDGNYDAGGGAGWLEGNGEVSPANDASYGFAPRNSGRGGFRSADGSDDWGGHGGFGGGGGGTTENGNGAGGGGYSGGPKGNNSSTYRGGGGGGSYYEGNLVSSSADNTGQGYITITLL